MTTFIIFVVLAIIVGLSIHFMLEHWKTPSICEGCKNRKAADDIWSILDTTGKMNNDIDEDEELSDE